MSLIRNIFAEPVSTRFDSAEQLIEQLHVCSKDIIAGKKFNILISPAIFVAGAGTKRGSAHGSLCDGNGLAQDGGTMTPEITPANFPGIRFIAMNTYSGFTRYIIPTSRPVTADEYERIWDYLNHIIDMPDSGIDISKRPACSLFYLPSQAADPSKSFWCEQQGEYLDCDSIPFVQAKPMLHVMPRNIMSSSRSAVAHVMSVISQTGSGRHFRDYQRIFGFIQHNRLSFSEGDLRDILNAWRQVDITKSRSKDFWKAVSKNPRSTGSQLAIAA